MANILFRVQSKECADKFSTIKRFIAAAAWKRTPCDDGAGVRAGEGGGDGEGAGAAASSSSSSGSAASTPGRCLCTSVICLIFCSHTMCAGMIDLA